MATEGSAADQLRLRYETYLQRERGLSQVTIDGYRPFVHRFLDEHPRDSLRALGPADDTDLNLKEQALAKTTAALGLKPGRFRADDELVAFLEAL